LHSTNGKYRLNLSIVSELNPPPTTLAAAMPKHEKGTPKEIANRCKSKGLQKLKWFCQMCNKQCRDQNGFKCHLTSESHQRQLLLFAENSNSYLRQFSREFEGNFMHVCLL